MSDGYSITRDGEIIRLTLDRPDEGNMLTLSMASTIAAQIRDVGSDKLAKAIVIRGTGDDFCKGRDPKGAPEGKPTNAVEMIKSDVFIKHIKGPLFFGSTSDFQQLAAQIPASAAMVIMRLGRMQYMDQSGLYAMEDMLLDLKTKNIKVVFVDLLRQPRYMMERIDIIPDFISEEQIFKDFTHCEAWVKEHAKDHIENT